MSRFNFDSELFRRVISKCEKTEKIPLLSHMVKKAVDVFYDEFDYYPDTAAYAPGSFTIMGDHLEYVQGNLVQGALPMLTVIVGKPLCSIKCRVVTTSRNVEGLRKSVFPISFYKKNLKVFPEWVNFVKGAINSFPGKDLKGFDAVVHSSIPVCRGYGSSAALQVGLYTFLEAATGEKSCGKKEEKGSLCQLAERPAQMEEYKMGQWNNFTSAVAVENTGVKINCRTRKVSTFEIRDIDILFLLTYPNFEIEVKDRDLVPRRLMELKLIAKLLGLENIIDATERHLEVLANMEDPSRETLEEILRGLGIDEDIIREYLDELFYFPRPDVPGDDLYGEGEFYLGETDSEEYLREEGGEEEDFDAAESSLAKNSSQQPVGVSRGPCLLQKDTFKEISKERLPVAKEPPVSYIHQRIAEICAGKSGSNLSLPKRICEEINCLGGIDNLSVASDLTVMGKLLRRLRHVVTENMRSLALPDVLTHVDYEEFGSKLIQSHLSLKLDYQVSCPTLDGLVQLAIDTERVYGAKMMSGGGTLTLLHRSVVEELVDKIVEKFGSDFQFYLVFPSSGAKTVSVGVKRNPRSTLSEPFLTEDELMRRAIGNFEATYKYRPTHGSFAPAGVNLIGDYPDYNKAFCISLAINMVTVVVGAFNGTSKIRACTTTDVGNERRRVIFALPEFGDMSPGNSDWANLIRGVVVHFKGSLKGFDCLIDSSLPLNSSIGSKSALIISFYTFMEELTGQKDVKPLEKAHRCMMASQEFSKVLSGLGDHIVLIRSKKESVVFVDSRSGSSTLIPFHDPSVTLVLTLLRRESNCSKSVFYNRMEECYDVAKALGGKTLRCLTLKDLEALKDSKIPEKSIRRARHVITESTRVLMAAEALKNNDYETLGELMIASHNSLRDDYSMSKPVLDRLVTCSMEVDGVLGSKVPGSCHFSGILSLVKRWAVDDLIEYLQQNTSEEILSHVITPYDHCNSLPVKKYLAAHPSVQFVFEDIFPF